MNSSSLLKSFSVSTPPGYNKKNNMRITRPTRHIVKLLTYLTAVIVFIVLFINIWRKYSDGIAKDGKATKLQTGNFPWVKQKLIQIENSGILEYGLSSNANSESSAHVLKVIVEHISALEHRFNGLEQKLFISQPVINNYTFSYIQNPVEKCTSSEIDILIIVRSATLNFTKRQKIRNGAIGDYVRNPENKTKLLFFLGHVFSNKYSKTHQKSIMSESKTNGDITQEDFEDVNSNNRLKSISALRWPTLFCPGIKYIISSDDDVAFDIPNVVAALKRISKTMDSFVVASEGVANLLEIAKKHDNSLTAEDYSELPSNLMGALQGFPMKTNYMLYEAALRVNPVWLEDSYATSICARKMHIPVMSDPAFVFQRI